MPKYFSAGMFSFRRLVTFWFAFFLRANWNASLVVLITTNKNTCNLNVACMFPFRRLLKTSIITFLFAFFLRANWNTLLALLTTNKKTTYSLPARCSIVFAYSSTRRVFSCDECLLRASTLPWHREPGR